MAEDTERTRSLWFALLLTLANGFLDAHTYLARGSQVLWQIPASERHAAQSKV